MKSIAVFPAETLCPASPLVTGTGDACIVMYPPCLRCQAWRLHKITIRDVASCRHAVILAETSCVTSICRLSRRITVKHTAQHNMGVKDVMVAEQLLHAFRVPALPAGRSYLHNYQLFFTAAGSRRFCLMLCKLCQRIIVICIFQGSAQLFFL